MSEEQDSIIVTVGGDSDDDNDDVLLTENSETECTEDTDSTDGVLSLQPNLQSGSDNSQPPSQMSNVEGLAGLGDQLASQMSYPENLKIHNPDSAGVEFIPLHIEGTSSVSKKDNVGLQDLIENTNKQVTKLFGIISKMQNNMEEQSLLNRTSPVVPTAGEPSLVNTPEMMGSHNMGPDNASSSVHIPHNFEMQKIAENIQENNLEAMNCPTVSKIDNGQCSSLICLPPGYLGDPKRNVTIHKVFLMNAQKKPEPKHAARYLVRNLFSREVLLCSIAVTSNSRRNPKNRQPLDPNIMAALREHLVTNFPNHDLHECGGEWKACISYVNSLLRYLRSAAQKKAKTVVPTKRSTPASVDLDDERDADGDKGSFLLPKQEVASETNANGNSQPNSIAVPEGFEGPSTSASMAPYRELHYIGNPSRNVQVSYSVLMIAKRKACPQMSASYLIGQLFPEEVLLNSTIYGNLWQGVCALNYNMISALREFLQENYPRCDLSESGREWKMCVKSMNYYIRTLKHGYSNYTSESSSVSEMISSSSNSESSDTDLSD
uniref:BEN domain containing 2 n=1 Tax=Myotis myotis TaxID=51298 RepID=A0A7J7YDH8_MYOMY|nr:BEN domain containing 2 [Myotis myotis]